LGPPDPIVACVPFFYGWAMLPIALLGQIATSPGQTYAISVFNDSFRHEFGLNHSQLTGAYMLGTLLASLPMTKLGGLMDRHGIRQTMTWVVLLFGATCIATSQVNGLVTLTIAFLMLRMLGQGALSLLSSNTLAMWFHNRLGTAAGIMSAGSAMAVVVIPVLNLLLIDRFGWRWTYALLGLAVWAVMLPLLAVFYRNRPEDIGQLPDGAKSVPADEPGASAMASPAWGMTLGQTTRTRAYWILLSMNVIWSLVGTAIIFNMLPLFESRGLTTGDLKTFFFIYGTSMATMQILGGLLADRFRLNGLLMLAMAGMTATLVLLTEVESRSASWLFAVAFGASQGLFGVTGQTVWARYFGRAHLGKIRGTIWTGCVAGSAVGPFVMGVTKDLTGVYTPSLWMFAAVYAALTVAALFATPPRREA
jgi:MFS family permease